MVATRLRRAWLLRTFSPAPRWRAKPASSWSVDRCEGGRHGGGLGAKLREKLCLFQEKKKKVLGVQGGAVM